MELERGDQADDALGQNRGCGERMGGLDLVLGSQGDLAPDARPPLPVRDGPASPVQFLRPRNPSAGAFPGPSGDRAHAPADPAGCHRGDVSQPSSSIQQRFYHILVNLKSGILVQFLLHAGLLSVPDIGSASFARRPHGGGKPSPWPAPWSPAHPHLRGISPATPPIE